MIIYINNDVITSFQFPEDTIHTLVNTDQILISDLSKYAILPGNITFYTRQEQGNFVKSRKDEVELLFNEIDLMLDQFAEVGICDRKTAHIRPRDFVLNPRYFKPLGFNTDIEGDSCLITEWAIT